MTTTARPLQKTLRAQLEKTIQEARAIAELAARASLSHLGVGDPAPPAYLDEPARDLRRRLRAHGRGLGDRLDPATDAQSIDLLVEEVAYEHWHRMLFARFLAENDLLMMPTGAALVPVTLAECEELAPEHGAADGWTLAARLAAGLLPQIFRPDSPVFSLTFPREHQGPLERLVTALPREVFLASDALGWVYQYWQTRRKEDVNASAVKIGARELPAVTQLFTEPYMVAFLLDNALGAWWALSRLTEEDLRTAIGEDELRAKAALPGVPLTYLRFVKESVEAASCRLSDKVEAASSRLVPGTMLGFLDSSDEIANLSGNLPHWRQDGVTYFVTFRTADSLPQEKWKAWQAEKDQWLEAHPEPHDEKTRKEFYEKFPNRLQRWLDQGYGDCLLKDDSCKTIVTDALKHFDGVRYHLDEYVVMPNHVHVIVTPADGHDLSSILHSWKSFTALKIHQQTGESGSFWQKESFDHIIRNPRQLERIRDYIRSHPAHESAEAASSRLESDKRQDAASTLQEEKRQDAASTFKWRPAAGRFDAWPKSLAELKVLDPCCGSGHFLVAALHMLVPMRMHLEELSAREAVSAVLSQNLHGLELDRRCVELAAFALALSAWTWPGAGGYRPLPAMRLACSGLSVGAAKEEWKALALGRHNLRIALDWMHEVFAQAPTLGSLIDPARTQAAALVSWDELAGLLDQALSQEEPDERHEAAVTARGLSDAARLLAGRYHWVITNVPYLARGKQDEALRTFCEQHYPEAKTDLATVFLQRCLELCQDGAGVVSVVLPQNWLFLGSYRKFREKLLTRDTWRLVARLGPKAFETPMWDFNVQMLTIGAGGALPAEEAGSLFDMVEKVEEKVEAASCRLSEKKRLEAASTISGLDVAGLKTAADKDAALRTTELQVVSQAKQLENPDARVAFGNELIKELLNNSSRCHHGLVCGDRPRMCVFFWEVITNIKIWIPYCGTVNNNIHYSGKETYLRWVGGTGAIKELKGATNLETNAWEKTGIVISAMGGLPVTMYTGMAFDNNTSVIVPHDPAHLPAIWCFCSSPEYHEVVRQIDQSLKVTNATLVKVPFDLARWTQVAKEQYPHGLPQPFSDDPTQWIFHGHPCGSVIWDEREKRTAEGPLREDATVLQVAVARLLGYRWPAELDLQKTSGRMPLPQLDPQMALAPEQRLWVGRCESLLSHQDDDGIVCIAPVRGEDPAAERLLNLLAAAYGDAWRPERLSRLLAAADCPGWTLEAWLREKFFAQHCKLFQNRPFIWQIWDGLRDGFSALVHYHRFDRKLLEALIYTYLGDWIVRQKAEHAAGVDGALEKLDAAGNLKKRLELILEGEAPYDIFVRWKPLEQQPLGWEPDLDDGVRLNLRPFLSVPDVGKKGAGVLRDRPNVKWDKDRGKDVETAPWYPVFSGDRINDHHLSLDAKRKARAKETKP